MKKLSKIKNKTPLKREEINEDYSNTISRIYKEKDSGKDYIYVINHQKSNLKTRNQDKEDSLNNTLKAEHKKFDIFSNEFKEEIVDITSSRKKSKKKKIKKKKKSVKKDIVTEYEEEGRFKKKVNDVNNKNGIKVETPIHDSKYGTNKFYLIDYNSKGQKDIYGINEPNPIMTEDNYNTFHQNELEENSKEEIIINEKRSSLTEKFKRNNFSFSSSTSYKFSKSQNSNRSTVNEKINPERLNFDIIKDLTNLKNNKYIKNEKLRKIRFRKENNSQQNELIINLNRKEKFKIRENDINEDISIKNKEKENRRPSMHKKRKKLSKKKLLMKNNKVILIQSIWRRYKIRKLIKFFKNLPNFCFMLNLIINKRLKHYFLFLLVQIKLFYSYKKNNDINKYSKDKHKKKIKSKKFKNISIRSLDNSLSEKENSFNDLKDINSKFLKNNLLEDKKLFISSFNDIEDDSNDINTKENISYDNTDTNHYLRNSNMNVSSDDNTINNENKNLKHNKGFNILSKDKKERLFKNLKNKSKLKSFGLYKKAKGVKRNLSLSCDSLIGELSKKKYKKPEVKVPSIKTNFHKALDISSSLNFNSVPIIANETNNISLANSQFTHDKLNNGQINDISFIKEQKRKKSYHKKIIAENSFSKTKNKKIKNVFSAIKFIFNIKDIICNIIKKNNFYYIIGFLKIKSLLQNVINIFQRRINNIMKNILNEFKCKIKVLKYLEQSKNEEIIQKNKDTKMNEINSSFRDNEFKGSNNRLFNENYIESNELSILVNSKKTENNKMKNIKIKNNIFQSDNLFIDKVVNKFSIKQDYLKENKFNNRKLKIEKNISKIKIEEKPNNEKFNDNKLIISKITPILNINNQKKKSNFIIDKVIHKFNIKDKKKKTELIISKIIRESPFINMVKNSVKNNFIITNVINQLNFNGVLIKKNHVIDRVNSDCIIDDIDSYNKSNKLKYYYSLIMNNINNLIISRIVSNFNIIGKKNKNIFSITNKEMCIKSNKNNNYIITKKVSNYILGNNLITKNLYKFNEKKLIITKVIKDYMVKMKGVDKNKKLIIYSTSLIKIKFIIIKSIKNFVYPSLINKMKNYSFCYHMYNINKIKKNEMRYIFINNLRNAIFELKYKKLYSSQRFDDLVINNIIKFNIIFNSNDDIGDNTILDEKDIIYNVEDNTEKFKKRLKKNSANQIPKHYIIHKDKLLTMKNDISNGENSVMNNYEEKFLEKLYERKNKYFVRGNVITKKISIIIGNNDKQNFSESKNISIKQFPVYSPKEPKGKIKNEKKIYISRLKMNNVKNFNSINNNFRKEYINNINSSNTNNSINTNNSNNTANTINTNNNITINSIINSPKSNTFRSTDKMRQYFQINNSPSLENEEENYYIRNIKEKRLNFNKKVYKDIQFEKKYLINEGQSKEVKDIIGIDKLESEIESEKNEYKMIDEQTQEKRIDNNIYFNKNNKENFQYRNVRIVEKPKISFTDKKQFISEEEEENEIEEEEEEIELENIKEILIKFISKKSNVLKEKLLNSFQKWRRFKNSIPLIYSKNNKLIRAQMKYKREINKDLYGNDEINRSKRLFIIYRKYHNYSFMKKKLYLRKWRKIVKDYFEKKDYYYEDAEEKEYEELEEDE